jgi:hypothetical protein
MRQTGVQALLARLGNRFHLTLGGRMKIIIATALILLFGIGFNILTKPPPAPRPVFPYKDKTDFAYEFGKGEVSIDMVDTTLRMNELYKLKYAFHATGSYSVYNWPLSSLSTMPGELAIYDENKKYIGNLIYSTGGSFTGIMEGYWKFLRDETYLNTSKSFRAGWVPSISRSHKLSPGTYYIQLILYKALLASSPFHATGDDLSARMKDFYTNFDRTELCRSNVIKVNIVAQ